MDLADLKLVSSLQSMATDIIHAPTQVRFSPSPNRARTYLRGANEEDPFMSAFQQLRISGSNLRSFICLALALPPTLMIAAAPRMAAAQNESHPENQFAYVADQGSGKILGYVLNTANGKLTPVAGSPFSTGKSGSTSVAVDPAGRFLYATNQNAGDNDISGFRIDCDSGRLTPIPGSPFASGAGPTAVAIDPSGRFAYVANRGSNNVSAFTIDEKSGRLSPVTGSPFAAGTFPSAIAVDPLGKDVFVTNSKSNNVSGYAINHSTGALTPLPGSPYAAQNSPSSVAVDPNDKWVYVANQGSNDISGYYIDPTSGALGPLNGSPFAAGAGGVNSVTVDPSGQYVYLAGYGGLFVYSINQFAPINFSGLTLVSGSPFGGGNPNFVAVDYTGTFLYVANRSSNDISAYKISSSSTLTPIPGSPFTAVADPVSIALVRPRTHPIYSATEIPESGELGFISNISATGVNNKGEVSGTVTYNPEAEYFKQAFIYAGGMNIGISFDQGSAGNAINNNGQVVGSTDDGPIFSGFGPGHAFIYNYSDNTELDLDILMSGQESDGLAINSAGDITGFVSTGTCQGSQPFTPACLAPFHAFVYQGFGLVDIGTLGGTYSEGTGINDQNEIAGVSSVAGSSLNHLFLYAQSHMRDLGGVAGESFINAAINNRGEIVGSAINSAGTESSFIYRGHSFEKIPLVAAGLNNNGHIAGSYTAANGSSHAALYRDGRLIDLNDLVDPSLIFLTNAGGISDNGNIVASGLNGHLYVLTPR
jgi:probable HAF family extracellular repeat protein